MKDGTYIVRMDINGMPVLNDPVFMAYGYWVADDTGVAVHGKLTERGLIDALYLMDIQSGEIVGLWENEGLTYVDRSYHFEDIDEATEAAKVFDQIAIWDCANSEDIRV